MSVKELEARVIALEQQVKQLVHSHGGLSSGGGHDWEASIEKFKNDEHLLAVLSEAMKLRDKERRAARSSRPKSRRAKP